jgi:pyridoxine 4-dehydrogenase
VTVVTVDAGTFHIGTRTVHRIGFGAMQLPGPGVFGPPRDHDEAVAVVRRAVELGVDHIDTAQYYGPVVANQLLREALHPYPDNLVLVSKVGAVRDDKGGWRPAQAPEQLRAGVLENLHTLGVDRLDAVNLRLGLEPSGVTFDEQLDAMIAMRDEGLIGGVGLSNVTLDQFEHALTRTAVVCAQNAMNVADRGSAPILRACREHDIAFVPFFPLGSAFGATNPVLTDPDVQSIAKRLGATPAQVALAWLLAQAPNVLVIAGTRSPAHLAENLAAGSVHLDDEALAVLNPHGRSS